LTCAAVDGKQQELVAVQGRSLLGCLGTYKKGSGAKNLDYGYFNLRGFWNNTSVMQVIASLYGDKKKG